MELPRYQKPEPAHKRLKRLKKERKEALNYLVSLGKKAADRAPHGPAVWIEGLKVTFVHDEHNADYVVDHKTKGWLLGTIAGASYYLGKNGMTYRPAFAGGPVRPGVVTAEAVNPITQNIDELLRVLEVWPNPPLTAPPSH